MTTAEFISKATDIILSYELDGKPAPSAQVQCVWLGYVLGNIKGMFIVLVDGKPDSRYFEATYRLSTADIWVDVYHKRANIKHNITQAKN